MTTFSYVAISANKKKVTGTIDALSDQEVTKHLMQQHLIPKEITEVSDGAFSDFKVFQLFKKKINKGHVILFSRQMYSLSKAGVPIIRSIQTIAKANESHEFVDVLLDIATQLESGRTLSQALSKHDKVFSLLYINIIAMGETTGSLDETFYQLTQYLERDKETVSQVKTALRYPSFVITAIFIAMIILNIFVLPSFKGMFMQFHAELPLPTQILIGISDFMVDYWKLLVLLIGTSLFLVYKWLHTARGELIYDTYILKTPIIGKLIRKSIMERFCRAFSLINIKGVPIIEGLFSITTAIGNQYIAGQIKTMYLGIEKGESVSRMAIQSGAFTPIVTQMLLVGEETGRIGEMLVEVADYYEQEVKVDIKNLSTSIEPLLIVVMGLMILVLALGIFLPMWNLSDIFKH